MTQPDDEFTELVDADIPRVDLVDKAANGMRFLIAKRADSNAGLFDPEFVRDLVAKAEADEQPQGDMVTMTGSPAAIARLIHGAPVRPVTKADMSTADVNDLPDSDFAYIEPGGTKDESGRTTPRSLRHFPLNDEAHVRNALSRAPQSPFGDKAMPRIRSAAKKLGIEVSKMADDVLDAAEVLAEPEENLPGADTTPGSPAWEAVDAATARKWTSILARAKAAVELLAEREMLEAASGEGDDAEQAFALDDACCAIDYAIGVLAPFAVEEQAEAEQGADELNGVRKALGDWDPEPLGVIEALGQVRKAGRVLSSANEAAIRGAVDSLQKVLASLPQAPTVVEKESGQPAAKPIKEPNVSEPVVKTDPTPAEPQAPAAPDAPTTPPAEPVTKADGEKPQMVAVYDSNGNLVGVCDPADITAVQGAKPKGDGSEEAEPAPVEPAAEATPDLTPAPPAEVGTPADAVPDDVNKTSNIDTDTVAKALAAAVKEHLAGLVTTQGEDIAKVAELTKALQDRVNALEEQPAAPKVFSNGAVPPRDQMRGQDRGVPQVDVAKAAELKQTLYKGTAAEQNAAFAEMQAAAIDALAAIQRR